MSEKITIQDIIELLAEKHSMTKKDAETFVKGMFELIEEALATEKYVKVKGLGTFKLTEVESRESVNVNTGERFEIQGHTKISFTPDSSMKDLINKPFAHFETVILNENTKLEDTETEIEGEEEEKEDTFDEVTTDVLEKAVVAEVVTSVETEENENPQEEDHAAIAEDFIPTAEESIVEEPEISVETAEEEPQIMEPEKEVPEEIVIEVSEDEDANTATEVADSETENSAEETESKIVDGPQEEEVMTIADAAMLAAREEKTLSETIASSEDAGLTEESITPVTPKLEEEQKEEEIIRMQEDGGEKKAKTPWGIIIAIILILCIAGGIYWYMQSDKTPASQAPVPTNSPQTQSDKVAPVVPVNDSLMQNNDTVRASVSNVPTEETMNQPTQAAPTTTTGNTNVAKETLADTIEYDITGTKTNHTLQEGESLVKLAVKFYGTKKLWPYIVKHNKNIIKDADRVPIGTTLRIPELTPKK